MASTDPSVAGADIKFHSFQLPLLLGSQHCSQLMKDKN